VVGGVPNDVAEREPRPEWLHRPCPNLNFEALYVAHGHRVDGVPQGRAFDPLEGEPVLREVRFLVMARLGLLDVEEIWGAILKKRWEFPTRVYDWELALTEQLAGFLSAGVSWVEWAAEDTGVYDIMVVKNVCLEMVVERWGA
jgi:hypothetical protein